MKPMRLRSMLFAVLAAAVLVTGRAAAQQADTTPDVLRLRQACTGRMVRVVATSGEMVRGRCGPVEDARLVVRDTAGRVWEMPYGSIRQIQVRRSGARKGAIVGGLAGGVLGGL
jgi:uncharacterized hydantoinase/oxoprolinase family protein